VSETRISRLRHLLETDPDDAFTRYALALEHAGQDDLPTAIALLESLRTQHPDYIPAYHQLGILYERHGSPETAATMYTEGISVARKAGDDHAAAEMQDALDLLS